MRLLPALSLVLTLCWLSPVSGQVAVYRPYGATQTPLQTWQTALTRNLPASTPAPGSGSRPVLPGLRPIENELLVDALIRKQPRNLRNNPSLARRYLSDLSVQGLDPTKNRRLFTLYGDMAEALYLHKHPDWNYVRKPNAPQNDVWKQLNARGHKIGGQVKYKFRFEHSAPRYLRDMMTDNKASRFIVPDDHVAPLRSHIQAKYSAAKAAGKINLAEKLASQKQRVSPLGYTSKEVASKTHDAIRAASAESNAVYVSVGAGLAISMGHAAWAYSRGQLTFDQASYTAARGAALVGSGVLADQMLIQCGGEFLRGTLQGNALVGLAVLVVDTSWSVIEKGGRAAFSEPAFYTQLGGSVSAATVGMAVGMVATGAAVETGPFAPVIGTVAGALSGTAAYFAGSYATNEFLREFYPSLYNSQQRRLVDNARRSTEEKISALQSTSL